LDQFLKKIPSVKESPKDTHKEETISEIKNEDSRLPRRTKRLSNTHVSKSDTDLVKMANGTTEETSTTSTRKFFYYSFISKILK
jgi:hypothetical protein